MQEGGRKLKESDKFLRQRGWEERRGRETIKNAGEREIPNFWSHKSKDRGKNKQIEYEKTF